MTKSLLMIHGIGCGGEVWDRMRVGFEAAGWNCDAPTLFPDSGCVTLLQLRCLISAWMTM